METIRLKLPNVDRVGLVLDISEVLAARKINIISMEVEPNTAYLELEPMTLGRSGWEWCQLCFIPQMLDVVDR